MSNYIDQFETGGVVYDVFDSGAVRKEQGKGLSTNDFTDADKQKLDGLASQAYVTVAELPTASADTMGAIYLVPSSNPQTQNVKDEYVTLRSGTEGSYTYAWEKIGDTSVDVSGKADKVASAVNGNFAGLDGNGNLTDSGKKASDFLTQHQDISGKADKDTDAVTGNFAAFDASGNPVDSGKKASDFLTEHQDISGKADKATTLAGYGITDAKIENGTITLGSNTITPLTSHQDITGKADKVSGATADNFAGLDANGNLTDSGSKASDFATAAQGAKADTAYQKPVSGIPSTDLASGVIPDVSGFYTKPAGGIPSTDLASGVIPDVSSKENTSNKVTSLSSQSTTTQYPAAKTVYDEIHPATGSSIAAGGLVPNKLYKLGTLTGSVTIAFASPADANIENEYKFTFTAGSTPPNLSWPAAITKWCGNAIVEGAPDVVADTYYEVSVEDGMGIFNKFE